MTHEEIMFHKDRCEGAHGGCAVCSLKQALDAMSEARGWIATGLKQGATTIGTLEKVRKALAAEKELLGRCVDSEHQSWLKRFRQREEAKR
jgi:hypothetical protein